MTRGVPPTCESPSGDSLALTAPAGRRPRRTDHGRRLSKAFQALDEFPALVESRDRLLAVIADEHRASADVVAAVESDVALMIGVLRLANAQPAGRGRVETVPVAIELLPAQAIRVLAERVRTFDFFARIGVWSSAPERFRLHALATQRAADRIASGAGYASRDRLAVTSLLHDIGKLVLIRAHPGYRSQVRRRARTPEERIRQEHTELGVDHAVVAGVLIRRWGLPASLASPIEHHHSPDAGGEAAIIRLADMLAHQRHGGRVSPGEMLLSAGAVGLAPGELRWLMCDLTGPSQRRRQIDPSPLSGRELAVLEQLARGSVYNQIAHDLALSPGTVRTHLHNIYRKLGVANRTQAVLTADERGWLPALSWARTAGAAGTADYG